MINSYDSYDNKLPKINGILWQMLLNNVPLRRPWDTVGATKTLIQWIAVDGYAFVDNPWLPSYNLKLDMDEFCTHTFASEVILGTAGYFSETTSRNSIPEMADLAAKFASMGWPKNVKGYYFPVEIDPTWTDAKEKLGPYWAQLPRPLYISAYYGNGIDGQEAAEWLYDLLPKEDNVILLFQDGVGAFNHPLSLAKERLGQLEALFGKSRVQLIAEVFKENPDWDGTPGEFFIPLTEAEYRNRISFYQDVYNEGRLWAFDGPSYIPNELIDDLNVRPTLDYPTNLRATIDNRDNIRLYSDVPTGTIGHSTKYTVYDTSGNVVLREYISTPGQDFGVYPKADYLADFGFPPGVVVMDAQTFRNDIYYSDRSPLTIATVTDDESVVQAKAIRSNWGDVVFKIWAAEQFPNAYEYKVVIKNPTTSGTLRTILYTPPIQENNIVRVVWDNDLNAPDYATAFPGIIGTWGFVEYEIYARNVAEGGDEFFIGDYSDVIEEDNLDFTKKTAICGLNSLVGGYFNDLSDPLNPGTSGADGRRDVVAAATWRNSVAAGLGLNRHEVMPVNAYVGSAPLLKMDWFPGFDPENYWWDHVNGVPGPDLIAADAIVQALGKAPDYFLQSSPGEVFGISADAPYPSTLEADWRQANIDMLYWMQVNWGNPNLQMWFQGATTTFFGSAPPREIGGRGAYMMRKLQIDLATNEPGFYIGSYVPDSNLYTTYHDETPNWLHYSLDAYHAAAAEMGTSIALGRNLAGNPPVWATMAPVDGSSAVKVAGGNINLTWTIRPGATQWKVENYSVATNALLSSTVVSANAWTFTAAEQVAAYGFQTNSLVIRICEYDSATTTDGPKEQHTFTGL